MNAILEKDYFIILYIIFDFRIPLFWVRALKSDKLRFIIWQIFCSNFFFRYFDSSIGEPTWCLSPENALKSRTELS